MKFNTSKIYSGSNLQRERLPGMKNVYKKKKSPFNIHIDNSLLKSLEKIRGWV